MPTKHFLALKMQYYFDVTSQLKVGGSFAAMQFRASDLEFVQNFEGKALWEIEEKDYDLEVLKPGVAYYVVLFSYKDPQLARVAMSSLSG